ncbi:MAG: cell division protein ZapA [Sphingomonas sp.]
MADVPITLGGRTHHIACRDGSEAQVARLGTLLEQRWDAAKQASGGLNDERTLLFVGLMLADALEEAQRGGGTKTADAGDALIAEIAERLESIALALEQAVPKD